MKGKISALVVLFVILVGGVILLLYYSRVPSLHSSGANSLDAESARGSGMDALNSSPHQIGGEEVLDEGAVVPGATFHRQGVSSASVPLDPNGLPAGSLEASLIVDDQALSVDQAMQALSSDSFSTFVKSLERNATSPAQAALTTADFSKGLSIASSGRDQKLGAIGCGARFCAFEMTSRLDAAAYGDWLKDAFSSRGLPGYATISLPIVEAGGVVTYRTIISIDPTLRSLSAPSGPPRR